MTQRKGQTLVNYIWKTRKKQIKAIRTPGFPELALFLSCQIIDQAIFYMSDEEFDKVFNE